MTQNEKNLRAFLMDENNFEACLWDLTLEYPNTYGIVLEDHNGTRMEHILIDAEDDLYYTTLHFHNHRRSYRYIKPTEEDIKLIIDYAAGLTGFDIIGSYSNRK